MKKVVLSIAVAATLSNFAMASEDIAPVAPAPVDEWSGFYVGGSFGAVQGKVDVEDVDGYNGNGNFYYDTSLLSVGIYAGRNWQYGRVVYGGELEIDYLTMKDHQQYPPYVGIRLPVDSQASFESGWGVLLTGRAGYTIDHTLFYVKAGLAGVDAKVHFIDDDPAGLILVSGTSKSEFLWGGAYGAGFETALKSDLFFRAEYMYLDIGDTITHTATANSGTTYTFSHKIKNMSSIKVSLTYKF